MKTMNKFWRRLRSLALVLSGLAALQATRADIVDVPAGYLTGTTIWRNTNTYILQGFVYVLDGAVLRIEPGTVIKGSTGTGPTDFGNLFICQGAKIFAQGTPQNPIIFTAEDDDVTDPTDLGPNDTQLWGGVILYGKARINNAVNAAGDAATPKYDVFEGLPDIQGPNGQYINRFGGGDDEDSSGILRYVSIRHGGKVLESNKEVNGLSICALGRGTTLEYIEVFANSDDGFEFFGGTVNTRYLVSSFNQDEQFDADEGYNGHNQFWFGIQPAASTEKGMEINGEPQDRITGKGVPVSNWEVYNATTIGAGARPGAGSGNNAFTFRAYTQVHVYNGIFTDFNGQPVTGGAYTTGANPTVQNNLWFGFSVPTYAPATLFDAANNNDVADPLLRGISREWPANGGLDPLPKEGSPAFANYKVPPQDGFYQIAPYRGAFDGKNNWLRHWTFLDQGGFLPPQTNVVEVPAGYLTGDITWKSTNIYLLKGFVYALDGTVLRIEPGTVIKGVAGTGPTDFGNLFICQGAKILAEGTRQNPIIFTAEDDDVNDPFDLGPNDTQLWGGVILYGKARINNAVNAAGDAATPKYDVFEGLPDLQGPNGQYINRFGGGDDNDSTGVMRYVSIRHGGKVLESNKEVNGLSICALGKGTTLEYIEVYANSDDGYEFFGGSVNTRYLVSAFNQDEEFDADEGYTGHNQFWFGIQPANSTEKGMEINGEPQDRITGKGVPISNWEIYNATTIGAGARAGAGSGNNAFTFRAYTQVGVYNGIFTDFNGQPVTGGAFTTGANPTVLNNIWFGFSVPTFAPASLFEAATGNTTNVNPALRGISREIPLVLDPRPDAASPANSSPRTAPADGFYSPVAYYGAFNSSQNWATDWTILANSLLMSPDGAYTPVNYPDSGGLTSVTIKPDAALPVELPQGSVTPNGPDAFTIAGPGLVAFPSASNANQPGDIQEFAYETITGDFDKIVRIQSITSGPVTDPVDAQASGGLEVRLSTGALSPSFLVNASNPLGANQVQVLGRAIEGQNYTVYGRAYPGV
ncbi:MAG: hypothetical protein JNL10_19585, partial [Verrucomicrobiales bacterium]|nr:hypothetical protein [Verrucomicrobiales bacterium]